MERLTTRNIAGVAVYKNPFECERCGETILRLPDYGNGSPTEKLSAYEDAEEQGLLLQLPCKVGDKLYRITPYVKEPIITTHVLQINIKQFFNEKIIVRIDVMDKMGESCYFLDDIGKKVFLSRAEAEAKLKEMEGAE